ncbi:MAG: bshB1 [Cytophagaceae bacterium]|jgi:bacillithiol biosynthesis deacetylase BshB1|nr:bshB1 [Cytophagaceae bacterium]
MKLDVLVFAAHPDDAELGCSGTIAAHIAKGYTVGVVDLTAGELGTRGTPELRAEEAKEASALLQLSVRECLHLADGFFEDDQQSIHAIIKAIRRYQPSIVIANAIYDRHPDHGRGSAIVSRASFLSGLTKIETDGLKAWRPQQVYHYIQDRYIKPDFIVDITNFWEVKIASIKAYKSQFFDPTSKEPQTYISSGEFLKFIEARALEFGHSSGFMYGEGFTVEKIPGVSNLFDLK